MRWQHVRAANASAGHAHVLALVSLPHEVHMSLFQAQNVYEAISI